MKKVLIIYYSGTFNTKYLVDTLKNNLIDYDITVYNVFNDYENIDFDFDHVFIMYPIYAFNAPKYFEKKLKTLPLNNLDYTIIKNSGEGLLFNNSSSSKIIKIMNKKNCHLISEHHLLMPYYIIIRHDDRMVKLMLQTNERYIKYIINNLNTPERIKKTFFSNLACFLGKLQRLGAKINSSLYRIDKKKCTMCLKCLHDCPIQCIENKKNKLIIHHNCLMCMRCSSFCPQDAFKIGFLNHWKVNGKYDYQKILNSSIENNYLDIASKKFKKVYQSYYQNIYKKIGTL